MLFLGVPLWPLVAVAAPFDLNVDQWREKFVREVDHRLEVPTADQARYVVLLKQALADANVIDASAQTLLLVDRSAQVQAAFLMLHTAEDAWLFIGATAVSTGKVGTYDHFLTPLGVFPHTLENPDFRAEGTLNENHIRGYGRRGMRVFDFGWQQAQRGWGTGAISQMRLQMHATDPNVLEARLGTVASEGCIRIPATLNIFLDAHGLLDAVYEQAVKDGRSLWVLKADRQTIEWPGQYMVIVDSLAEVRPVWSPAPKL
ncbi:L,D-transpeptidase [Janthinobacterium sp. HLX7-2]|uniref:L,D-transpeptidase n=1 Tax=Janthinobacterium sp. HLX7-2 TaxID=1259331 RepID=UPI003F524969